MKLYNQKLNKVIEGNKNLLSLLSAKGWVQVPEEEPKDAEVIEFQPDDKIKYDDTVYDSPGVKIDDSVLDSVQLDPEQEQVKPLEEKPKNKKRK